MKVQNERYHCFPHIIQKILKLFHFFFKISTLKAEIITVMTNSYQVCLTICTGAFLVSWETLALVYQGWANKSWGTALFAFFGGFVLALGLLGVIMCNVLSKRKRKNTKEHKSGKEEIEVTPIDPDTYTADITTAVSDTAEKKKKKQEEKADFIFDLINISTAMLTVIITVLFLNTFTSLWLRGVLHGRGAVRLSYGINEGTRALLSSSEPMINVTSYIYSKQYTYFSFSCAVLQRTT